jgi:hypothetical protein
MQMPVRATGRLVLTATCRSATRGLNLPPVDYVESVDGQHLIAFNEMSPVLGVSDQRKAKDEALAISDWGTLPYNL